MAFTLSDKLEVSQEMKSDQKHSDGNDQKIDLYFSPLFYTFFVVNIVVKIIYL